MLGAGPEHRRARGLRHFQIGHRLITRVRPRRGCFDHNRLSASSRSSGSGHCKPAAAARCKYPVTVPSPMAHAPAIARWLRPASYLRRSSSRSRLISSTFDRNECSRWGGIRTGRDRPDNPSCPDPHVASARRANSCSSIRTRADGTGCSDAGITTRTDGGSASSSPRRTRRGTSSEIHEIRVGLQLSQRQFAGSRRRPTGNGPDVGFGPTGRAPASPLDHVLYSSANALRPEVITTMYCLPFWAMYVIGVV